MAVGFRKSIYGGSRSGTMRPTRMWCSSTDSAFWTEGCTEDGQAGTIRTTIDNTWHESTVTAMQGGKQIPVGGGIWSFYVGGKPVWVIQEGKFAYTVLPEYTHNAYFCQETLKTDWVKYNAVNEGKKDLPTTADALRLWIDHGRDVKDGTYGYVVYAGYNHGESAPREDIYSLGYKVYNVQDYGAVPDDGQSDRQAFLDAVDDALGGKGWTLRSTYSTQSVEKANAIIYFPPGEYILYDKETDAIDGKSYSIEIRAGHFIIAGAGTSSGRFSGFALPDAEYYALYPYDEDAVLENGVIRTEIPTVQDGNLGDLTAVGYSDGPEIALKNVTGILKFTLDEDNVTKVTITAADGQTLAGAVDIAWNGGTPAVTAAEGASSSVAVGDGTAVLEKGVYYVNVLPADLSEYTLTFTYKEDKSSYSGYFDKWYPGDTRADASGRQTITRGVCELPLARTSAANPTAGTLADLGEMSATLVFYDDEVKTTINGVGMTSACWDNYDAGGNSYTDACTSDPYEGAKCFEWTCGKDWGQVGFQTWNDADPYARGNLNLTAYRNAHFSLQFAYKAEAGTTLYVKFIQHIAGFSCLRAIADLSEYATGDWQLVTIPLDEMKVSDYASEASKFDTLGLITVDDGTFDSEGNPFRWDKVCRLVYKFNEDSKDMSQKGKTVWIDDIKIKKVILSDQAAE